MATKPGDPFDRAGRRKDLVEMERRHIREGEALIARQEEIVCQLDSSGAHDHVLTARALLVAFREFVTLAKQHLEDLEREHPDTPPKQTMPRPARVEGSAAEGAHARR